MSALPAHIDFAGGAPEGADQVPDDWAPCCWGSTFDGPEGCTCWVPVFDLEQAPVQEGPATIRGKCCHDCAYRPGSPERVREEAGVENELEDAAAGIFLCHQGMRKVIAWRHPDGRQLPQEREHYQPPLHGRHAVRADGRPAEVCAGWRFTSGSRLSPEGTP